MSARTATQRPPSPITSELMGAPRAIPLSQARPIDRIRLTTQATATPLSLVGLDGRVIPPPPRPHGSVRALTQPHTTNPARATLPARVYAMLIGEIVASLKDRQRQLALLNGPPNDDHEHYDQVFAELVLDPTRATLAAAMTTQLQQPLEELVTRLYARTPDSDAVRDHLIAACTELIQRTWPHEMASVLEQLRDPRPFNFVSLARRYPDIAAPLLERWGEGWLLSGHPFPQQPSALTEALSEGVMQLHLRQLDDRT